MKPIVYLLLAALAAPQGRTQDVTYKANVKLVVVNLTVIGRDGKPIETLIKDDFQVFEDGKLQKLQTAELQRLDTKALPPIEPELQTARKPTTPIPPRKQLDMKEALSKYQDRRLMVMFFDFSSMAPAEQIRSVAAAEKFVKTQITASDMVSVMVYSSAVKTLLDFTDDRDALLATIRKLHIGEGSERAGQADTGADAQDQSGDFTADETEFNIFNTDLKLAALAEAARGLAQYPEKKALVYFSSGAQKTGVDNQSQLRATINTAVKSNVAFYPIDARGLQASAPGGDATAAAPAGNNLYTGTGQKSLRDNFHNQQETLDSLAADTGGKALLDSNDLTLGIKQVQQDVESYYVLAYASTNTADDGRFRRITIKLSATVTALKPKLVYRQGYYASTTYAKMNEADKEALLSQAVASENPLTDLPLAVEVDYFRLSKGKYFVPVSVKIPGSSLAFKNKGSKSATELDFIGQVMDAKGHVESVVRDTIPLKVNQATATEVVRKQIQYDTGFTLGPGKYQLRFVARENGEGKTGTFETNFVVPDLGTGGALRLSSVILSNQRESLKAQIASAQNNKKLLAQNPLIDADGRKTVPNITRVFRQGQSMFVYFEVYDPGVPASVEAAVALYQGNKKVFEGPGVRANRMSPRGDGILPVHMEASLKDLKPGKYTCQVSVIDQLGKKFAFPRTPVVLIPAS